MVRLLSILLLVVIIFLSIPTGLVLASQNSVPGDRTYPIKRKLEDMVVSAASLHPSTKAYFRLDFSKRRYAEATKLIEKGDSNSGKALGELTSQTSEALDDIIKLQDKKRKQELVKELIQNIDEYNKGLEQLKNTPVVNITTPTPTPSRGTSQTATPTPTPPPPSEDQDGAITSPTATPTPTPTITPPPATTDKCRSGEPLTPAETVECNNKLKYEACSNLGLTKEQCDELATVRVSQSGAKNSRLTVDETGLSAGGDSQSDSTGTLGTPTPSPSDPNLIPLGAPPLKAPVVTPTATPVPSTPTPTQTPVDASSWTKINDGGLIQNSGTWSGTTPHEIGTYGKDSLSLVANKTFKFTYEGLANIYAAQIDSSGNWSSGPFKKNEEIQVKSGSYIQLITDSPSTSWSDLYLFIKSK